MLRRLSLLLVFTLGLPSSAYQLRKDSKGEVVRWAARVEFVLDDQLAIQLGDSHTDAAVRAAVATLAAATPELVVSVRVGTSKSLGYVAGASDNQNDILVLDEWPYDPTALAATIVTLDTSTHQIIDADIVFNGSHQFRVVDAMGSAARSDQLDDIQNTLTHELGHALGLMHNPDDATVVMYPSAAPLEVSKRVLAKDDLAGLLALYGVSGATSAAPAITPLAGCSAAGDTGSGLALLALLLLPWLRRRLPRGLAAGLALAPLAGFAEPPAATERTEPDLTQARQISVAEVASSAIVRLPTHPGLIFTQLELTVRECVKGSCAQRVTLRVPGGRVGDLEQVVAHQPVPAVQEQLLLIAPAGTGQPAIMRLHDEAHRLAAARAFARAKLALPGSFAPQAGPAGPRQSLVNVPASLKK